MKLLSEEFGVGVAAPRVIIHGLVARGADADGEFLRRFRAGEHRGNPVGDLDPRVSSFGIISGATSRQRRILLKNHSLE